MIDFHATLYPLGWIASFIFFLRFYFQWLKSEKEKRSHVTPTFWHLSLSANIIMAVHGLIQLQYPLSLIQVCNAVISWRNLDLMQKDRKKTSLSRVVLLMVLAVFVMSLLFLLLWIYTGTFLWMRSPSVRGQNLSSFWHLLGLFGMGLFASRFWIQWLSVEKEKESRLNASFWWLSLLGGGLCLLYFARLFDLIQIAGYTLSLVPYIRNLALLKKKKPPLQRGTFFLVAGEKSGDLLGSRLIDDLKMQIPNVSFSGVGGSHMSASGMKCLVPMERLNVMGFSDVIKALPRLFSTFRLVKRTIFSQMPEMVILIDYPDFNMYLAKRLRKEGYEGKIVHYVCPSVWAWRKKRVFQLAKTHDLVLSIFPFEKEYFSQTSLDVRYVGHPLVNEDKHKGRGKEAPKYRQEFSGKTTACKDLQNAFEDQALKRKTYLSLFPGSRVHEIAKNLPIQLATAKKWLSGNKEFTLAISSASDELTILIKAELDACGLEAKIVPFEDRYELMNETILAIATSGTVTLELALHEVPSLVTYLLTPLNYFLGKYLFRIDLPYYCIVNIIAKTLVFPEFVGRSLSVDALHRCLTHLFGHREECIEALRKVRLALTTETQTAATSISSIPQAAIPAEKISPCVK